MTASNHTYSRLAGLSAQPGSGTDEHGTPIQVQADREGVTARELADRYNRVIAEDLQGLGLSYDLFTRTTTRNHYDVVQQTNRPNHFTVVEMWRSRNDHEANSMSAHQREFRDKLAQMTGALYDERLYEILE